MKLKLKIHEMIVFMKLLLVVILIGLANFMASYGLEMIARVDNEKKFAIINN